MAIDSALFGCVMLWTNSKWIDTIWKQPDNSSGDLCGASGNIWAKLNKALKMNETQPTLTNYSYNLMEFVFLKQAA